MGMIILIVIVVLIFIISNKINEKWYNELSENEKIRIRELDLRLSELNERVKKQMPKKYMLYRIIIPAISQYITSSIQVKKSDVLNVFLIALKKSNNIPNITPVIEKTRNKKA